MWNFYKNGHLQQIVICFYFHKWKENSAWILPFSLFLPILTMIGSNLYKIYRWSDKSENNMNWKREVFTAGSCHQHQAGGWTIEHWRLEDDMTTNNRNLTFLVISTLYQVPLSRLTLSPWRSLIIFNIEAKAMFECHSTGDNRSDLIL